MLRQVFSDFGIFPINRNYDFHLIFQWVRQPLSLSPMETGCPEMIGELVNSNSGEIISEEKLREINNLSRCVDAANAR